MPQIKLVSDAPFTTRLRRNVVGAFLAAGLFTSLLIINGLQTLSVVLIPFSSRAFRAFNRFAARTWWGWCVAVGRLVWKIEYRLSGDRPPRKENALIVVNHQQMTDITFLLALAKDAGQLGNLKWFLKDIIKYVPGIGWGLLYLDNVFLKRDWAKDRDNAVRTFSRLRRHRVPFWLVSFSEGTRSTPEKIEKGRNWSKKNDKPLLDHLLPPRPKGFAATVVGLGDHLDAVYDVTIGYPKGVPTLWQYITGFARSAHIDVRRHAASDLPKNEDELSAWLRERFDEKDKKLDAFYRDGVFPSTAVSRRTQSAQEKSACRACPAV